MKAQPPRCFPPQSFHLLAVFELVDLLQRCEVVFHALHVTTAVLEEAQQLVIDDVLVLHVCEDDTQVQTQQSPQEVLERRWNLISSTGPPGGPPRC